MHRERFYTLSASCPDRTGIVAKVSGFIAEHKGWILETALHAEPAVYADWLGAPFRAHCPDYLSHEFSLQLVNHSLVAGSYQIDAIANVRTRSHADRRFSMFRFKRYDEALLAETLARFGWEKLVARPIGDSDRAPVAMLLVKQ